MPHRGARTATISTRIASRKRNKRIACAMCRANEELQDKGNGENEPKKWIGSQERDHR